MFKRSEIFIFIIATLTGLSVAERPINEVLVNNLTRTDNPINYRLPSDTIPVSYKIELTPNIVVDAFTFTGKVEVEFNVEEATKKVTFHIDDITIIEKTIEIYDKTKPNVLLKFVKTTPDTDKQFYTIELEEQLAKGSSYILRLSYNGNLNDKLFGFYRSSYINDEGEVV